MAPVYPRRQSNSTSRSEGPSLRRRSSASRHHIAVISGDREGLSALVEPEDTLDRQKSIWDRLGIHPFRGMWKDIRRRAPYYLSDWTDAWTYRVIPSTFDMYFKKFPPRFKLWKYN
jgi:HCO3- transporter family